MYILLEAKLITPWPNLPVSGEKTIHNLYKNILLIRTVAFSSLRNPEVLKDSNSIAFKNKTFSNV